MNSEQLLQAIGYIDDAQVEEAGLPKPKAVFFNRRWLKPAAAACVLLIGAVVIRTATGWRWAGASGGGMYAASDSAASTAYASGTTADGAYIYDNGAMPEAAEDKEWYAGGADASAAVEMPAEAPVPEPVEGEAGAGASAGGNKQIDLSRQTARKIIYTADLSMESTDYDGGLSRLLALLDSHGGYIEACSEGGKAEDGNRWYSATLRIPSTAYSAFLAAAGDYGSVTWLSQSSRDITLDYVDLEARVGSLKTQRDRLNELAAQAETVEDLISIEEKLNEVEYRLESYASQLRVMENQVSMSTVNLDYREVSIAAPVNRTFGQRLGYSLANGWEHFVWGVQDLILDIGYSLPVLALAAAAILAAVLLWRHFRKKRK